VGRPSWSSQQRFFWRLGALPRSPAPFELELGNKRFYSPLPALRSPGAPFLSAALDRGHRPQGYHLLREPRHTQTIPVDPLASPWSQPIPVTSSQRTRPAFGLRMPLTTKPTQSSKRRHLNYVLADYCGLYTFVRKTPNIYASLAGEITPLRLCSCILDIFFGGGGLGLAGVSFVLSESD